MSSFKKVVHLKIVHTYEMITYTFSGNREILSTSQPHRRRRRSAVSKSIPPQPYELLGDHLRPTLELKLCEDGLI